MKKFSALWFLLYTPIVLAQSGLWSSAAELQSKPMESIAWQKVKSAADIANPADAKVSDQDSDNNVEILAAAIVYARTGEESYRNKVVSACEKLANAGKPADRTLAWARETGAYVLAADLVGYRTSEFETWCRNMAEVWEASDNRTLLNMYKQRPNNWGTQAFGSLCAIYAFLQDTVRITEIRNYWINGVLGPNPGFIYGSDLSWHVDAENLRLINPKGAVKQGINIDGIMPDDMRRNGSFSNPPPAASTSYHWEVLQGIVMGARILERIGQPIWDVGDSAIYRAVYVLQETWENQFGGWVAEGDDLWMLPFIDDAYGSNFSADQTERIWEHGKNTGWPYVITPDVVKVQKNRGDVLPELLRLYQNYPNPFSPEGGSLTIHAGNISGTRITYHLQERIQVDLDIFDRTGRQICSLIDDIQEAKIHTVDWQAIGLPGGLYFCRLKAGAQVETIKMVLLH